MCNVQILTHLIQNTGLRCVRNNLAGIRSEVDPKFQARIDDREIEKQFVCFYLSKFSRNHTPESILTDWEKKMIFNTVRSLAVKEEED